MINLWPAYSTVVFPTVFEPLRPVACTPIGRCQPWCLLWGGGQLVRQQSYFTDQGIVTNTGRWLSHQGLGVFFSSRLQMPAYDDFESRPIDTGPIAPSFPGMQPTCSACLFPTHAIHAPYTPSIRRANVLYQRVLRILLMHPSL